MFRLRSGWVILGVFILIALAVSATIVLAPNGLPGLSWMPASVAVALPPPPQPLFVRAGSGMMTPPKIKNVPAVFPEDPERRRLGGVGLLQDYRCAQEHVP